MDKAEQEKLLGHWDYHIEMVTSRAIQQEVKK